MAASRISVKNSFGSIRGAYRATTSISLDTIKGCVGLVCLLNSGPNLGLSQRNITTDITLANDPSGQPSTSLTLDTGDGYLISASERITVDQSRYVAKLILGLL